MAFRNMVARLFGSGRSGAARRRRQPRLWHEHLYYLFVQRLYSRDLYTGMQLRAQNQTLDYIDAHMRDCVLFWDRPSLLDFATAEMPASGSILEFGVEHGTSLRHLAKCAAPRQVHGFDSFIGLPEHWAGAFRLRGDFSTGGALPKVPANVTLHRGWFVDTLPAFCAANDEPIALLHIDCDLYSSTRDVLAALGDRLRPGSIIIFDEYFGYPNWQAHEFKAFAEYVAATGLTYEYLAHSVRNGHVVVRICGG